MANKADKIYFENMQASAKCACDASNYLVECLTNYNTEGINEMLTKMHELEHAGDTKNHEMSSMLARAFVTPVDREDIALISRDIDNVTDGIEEVLQKIYMCKIDNIIPPAIDFAKKIAECCQLMYDMLGEFENFKKPAKLHELIVDLNNIEDECDGLYISAFHDLDKFCQTNIAIVSWRDILDKLENCADTCEHVADSVNMVVMKNS